MKKQHIKKALMMLLIMLTFSMTFTATCTAASKSSKSKNTVQKFSRSKLINIKRITDKTRYIEGIAKPYSKIEICTREYYGTEIEYFDYTVKANKYGKYRKKVGKLVPGNHVFVKAYKDGKKYCMVNKDITTDKFTITESFRSPDQHILGCVPFKYRLRKWETADRKIYYKIGKKTYCSAILENGFFGGPVDTHLGTKPITFRLYDATGKFVAKYKRTPKKVITPKDDTPLNMKKINRDIARTKNNNKTISYSFAGQYRYYISEYSIAVGSQYHYMDFDYGNGGETIKAQNGITLYGTYNTDFDSDKRNYKDFPWPTKNKYDFKLNSGESKQFKYMDYQDIKGDRVTVQIKGYKNGKLVLLVRERFHIIKNPVTVYIFPDD